jgi:hypothetical protein
MATEDDVRQLANHLEFLGYSVQAGEEPDDWATATHPRRYNFFFMRTDGPILLHCVLTLGTEAEEQRHEWLEFINAGNLRSTLARFAMDKDSDGDTIVRIKAVLPGTYDRRLFGDLLERWHDDQDRMRGGPKASS